MGGEAPSDLSSVATSTLERLRDAIAEGRVQPPITRSALLGHGIHNQLEALEGALAGHSLLACLSVLDVVLAERRRQQQPPAELVWTGPERANATARDTAVVLRALFERAKHQVVVAGYNFTRGSAVLEPLFVGMRDRHLDVKFFVHIEQPQTTLVEPRSHGNQAVRAVMAQCWPFGAPRPKVYYDARALAPHPRFNMHAKCVVIDGECALVTSANFTEAAQERNLECGVLLEDATFARHLARQWLGLIDAKLVIEATLD